MPDKSPPSNVTAIGIVVRSFHVAEMLKDEFYNSIKTILLGYEESTLRGGIRKQTLNSR